MTARADASSSVALLCSADILWHILYVLRSFVGQYFAGFHFHRFHIFKS